MKQVTIAAIEGYIHALANCDKSDGVWEQCSTFFRQHGFDKITYHVMPLAWETSDNTLSTRSDGLSDTWNAHYHGQRLWQVDPILSTALGQSLPFYWSDLATLRTLSPADEAFMATFAQHIGSDGIAVQVFGPNGRNGYFGLGLVADDRHSVRRDVRVVQWACQLTHHRYCELETIHPVALSRREQEVLSWVARGKSNSSIADILSISSYTVDAYMRRIYQKLGVNDRVSASIQGLGSGLIKSAA